MLRRRDWEKMRERMEAAGIEAPTFPARILTEDFLRAMEEMERQITTTVDVSSVADRKRDALAAHASQLDESLWVKLPPEAFADVFGEETFIRSRDRTGAPVPEDDLFTGLR